jgi:aspartate/methionine/tyrosine aminotransferase
MTRLAVRINQLQQSGIRSITQYALEKGAISLAQGYPDFDPPSEIIDAAEKAMRNGSNQYGHSWGDPKLRCAIAKDCRRFYQQIADPVKHITVTCGVTEAIVATVMALIDPGDRVILLEPAHENYHAAVAFAGGVPIWVPLRPPNYTIDIDELKNAFQKGARAIIFNSPHNPSGRVFTREELCSIAKLCLDFDCIAISDEIYAHLVFDGRQHIPISTLSEMCERTVTIRGFGKTFAITGWRLGYVIAPEHLSVAIRQIHDFTTICAPTPLQAAMVAALDLEDAYYKELIGFYSAQRSRLLKILSSHGFHCHVPEGTYFMMADFRKIFGSDDDQEFARYLIDKIGIAGVPGSSLYTVNSSLGRGLIRFAFAKRNETLDLVEERFSRLNSDSEIRLEKHL